ncbi:hypothetical protein CIY_33900 [Butyrivibrio fibrisolvens 16/4]|nr:hypothetical protein CIY_33900 [Butyrivibrio fibrisolvens 16/4]
MGRVRPHRRNSYGNQLKALPMEAMYAAGVSIFSLAIYGAIMGVSIYMAGETPKFIGGIGMLGFFVALAAFIYNIAQMKTKTELKYRLICLAISVVAMAIWVGTFILGMIN